MPPKRRGRKPGVTKKTRSRKDKDPLYEGKRKRLDLFLAEFDENVENRCNSMKTDLVAACSKLQMLYNTSLLTIPKEYHSLTKAQFKEKLESKASEMNKIDDGVSKLFDLPSVMSKLESLRATTAKKKQKAKIFSSASKVQKKFGNDSTNTSMTDSRTTRRALAKMQAAATPVSRQVGLPVNYTPKVKKSSSYFNPPQPGVVTPKFDPRKPLVSSLLRKPKVGEIVMSMSGSPLQIPSVDVASKPGLMVSLGEGRVLNVGDPSGLSGIAMNLDQSTLQTLKLVNEKLAKVLAS